MDLLMSLVNWALENKAIILGALLAASEILALVPQVKANSVFQLILNALKSAQPAK